jgi:hypothetical protein
MIGGSRHPEMTVTSRSVAFINMSASFFNQSHLSIIDIKLSQCIKNRLGRCVAKSSCLAASLAQRRRAGE